MQERCGASQFITRGGTARCLADRRTFQRFLRLVSVSVLGWLVEVTLGRHHRRHGHGEVVVGA